MKRFRRPLHSVDTKRKYSHILPETGDWPVVQLSKDRKNFIEDVSEESFRRVEAIRSNSTSLIEELELTHYKEKLRIKTNPWKIDPEDEWVFWDRVKQNLVETGNIDRSQIKGLLDETLHDIIYRYSNEIAGNFKQSHYKLARRVANFGFARLLNAAKLKGWNAFFKDEYTLQDKIQLVGEVEHLRKLARIGTIVMVPTHFSNLDSITLGWAINELGLPPFIYGAGLNLFNINIFSYFMNSLGAYKVDRRKKNLIYLETLRTYSKQAIQRGCHSLFFPGGTRSRSGRIESRLKLGLLGTAIEAQRDNYMIYPREGRENKIFVVPVVINYSFVLEAPSLIHDYLERSGQERYYVENDEFSTSSRILSFLIQFFNKGSNISLSFGHGMDLFGNYVDENGKSIDVNGNHINTRDYFLYKGEITRDPQREEEYTRMLADKIVSVYHKINQVLPSHLAPFVAFQMLRKKYRKMDLFSMLRLPIEELEIEYNEFKSVFSTIRNRVFDLYEKGKLDISKDLTLEIDKVITLGVENVGMYHSKRPMIINKVGNISTQDVNTLYYYHNRMEGYELEKYI